MWKLKKPFFSNELSTFATATGQFLIARNWIMLLANEKIFTVTLLWIHRIIWYMCRTQWNSIKCITSVSAASALCWEMWETLKKLEAGCRSCCYSQCRSTGGHSKHWSQAEEVTHCRQVLNPSITHVGSPMLYWHWDIIINKKTIHTAAVCRVAGSI